MALACRRRGRTEPCPAESRFARPSIRCGTPSRRLVSMGSLSVPRLSTWASNPDRLRRGNRARSCADHERGNCPAGNRLGGPSGGTRRRDGGYRGRRHAERRAQPLCVFLKPYRTETDVLILPRGISGRYPFHTVEQMLETFARQKFRLGVVAGFVYADDRVNAFIADDAHKDQIVGVPSDAQNLRNLLAGVIDGFLADRITAATTAWRRHEGARIEEHPLRFSTNIHFMLSRATQTP